MQEMTAAHEKKREQCDNKQAELSRLGEELQNKAIQLRNQEAEIE
jgi:hypothetical protein